MADKRKQPSGKQNASNGRDRKRAKTRDARSIAAQSFGYAFKNGELEVDKFVKSRGYELKAMEDGMAKARKGLTTRAFQGVPRELRRRTASHNVKRVPKRLRPRATREMIEDNTPTVTARRRKPSGHMRLRLATAKRLQNLSAKVKARKEKKKETKGEGDMEVIVTPVEGDASVQEQDAVKTRKPRVKSSSPKNPPMPPAKFRKRQLNKQWLPTHMFHTKRAHLTPPKEPLWRFAVPMAPTMKCYRSMHRASTARGAIAWDMSYMSTIGLEGSEEHLQTLLQKFGAGAWDKKGQKWRNGTRTWEGWLYKKGGLLDTPIAPATVIWCANPKDEDVEMNEAPTAAVPAKKKNRRKVFIRIHPSAFLELWEEIRKLNPPVTVEDLRWEIGSIEITGPEATEALCGILSPISSTGSEDSPAAVWKTLVSITNLNTLPANSLLGFEISDPRLRHPPRQVSLPTDNASHSRLMNVLVSWPPDRTQGSPSLFERNKRLAASRSLPSQKSINRRKAIATPGAYPEPRPTDPIIPVLLLASAGKASNSGTWTLLLPWKCVSPVWNSLMYYPLFSGGNPRFGGLEQQKQLAFEAGVPWFPGDFPGTKAGREWDEKETERRKSEWERRPKGKRTEWDSLPLSNDRRGEVGRGWACDWDALVEGGDASSDEKVEQKPIVYQLPSSKATELLTLRDTSMIPDASSALVAVRVTLVARGCPTTCARIYRLPTTDPALRAKWLSLLPDLKAKNNSKRAKAAQLPRKPPSSAPEHLHQAYLAATLLEPEPSATQAGSENYPSVPDKEDLVGFVTAGNYNLTEGKGTGVGNLVLARVLPRSGDSEVEERLCIVRNAGEMVGRLARWEIV